MRIDKPVCGFKNCRHSFDRNCTDKVEYERCEYRRYKNTIGGIIKELEALIALIKESL